jgi:hypothetical protein
MIQPAASDWLVRTRDSLAHASFLQEPAAWRQLIEGFVACNFVIDQVEFLLGVLTLDEQIIAEDLTFGELRSWLVNRQSDSQNVFVGVCEVATPGVATELLLRPELGNNPWKAINTLMAVESIQRHLTRDAEPSVRETVSSIFARTLDKNITTSDGQSHRPAACSTRHDSTVESFHTWWRSSVESLSDFLKQPSWKRMLNEPSGFGDDARLRRVLGGALAEHFGASDMVKSLVNLYSKKQKQSESCLQLLKTALSLPMEISAGWAGTICSRMLSAQETGVCFEFAGQDHSMLQAVVKWLLTRKLDEWHQGDVLPLLDAAEKTPVRLEGQRLDSVLRAWEVVLAAMHIRGAPREWGKTLQVADLMFVPNPTQIRFEQWISSARTYGLQ